MTNLAFLHRQENYSNFICTVKSKLNASFWQNFSSKNPQVKKLLFLTRAALNGMYNILCVSSKKWLLQAAVP